MAKAKRTAKSKKGAAKATPTTAVVFSTKDGTTLGTIALTGTGGRLHESPERIKELMNLLDLPKGTDARIFAKATSVLVR